MSVETQLRSIAEAASAEQTPVTVDEAISRAAGDDVLDELNHTRRWMLVAASIALLVGGLVVLLAWNRSADEAPLPVVSTPDTTVPATTIVPSTTVPDISTTTAVPAPSPVVDSASAEALINEPTLDYRDDVVWWVPSGLPAGWRYGYAVDDGNVQTVRLLADDRSTIDVEFGADASTIGDAAVGAATEELGGESWEFADDNGAGVAARVVDGRLLVVRGPVEPVRSVASTLRQVPETTLVRPPFRADAEPGPVVLTLPADQVGGDQPFELRAHTDGLFTTVGGEIKQVSPEDPLAFGTYVYDLTGDADSYRVVVTGVALDRAEQITFGLMNGDDIEATTAHSGRFAESFYALVIDVPASVLEQYEQGGLAKLTRWTFTFVDGAQRVYDEPGSANCVNCGGQLPGADHGEDSAVAPETSAQEAPPATLEPTNDYGDESWLVPAEVPDGFEFAYAMRAFSGADVDHRVTYSFGDPQAGQTLSVQTRFRADGTPVPAPASSPSASEVVIDGATWMWDAGLLSGVVDGRSVEIWGDRDAAAAVAETLELVPESDLPRPPFDNDPSASVVVARLSGAPAVGAGRSELRAASDGKSILLDGGTPRTVTSAEPVVFAGSFSQSPAPGSGSSVIVVAGFTVPDVATLEFEQLDGNVVTIEPEDVSGRFGGIGFFLVAIEVPSGGTDTYASLVPSVIARDANGKVLTAISEPF